MIKVKMSGGGGAGSSNYASSGSAGGNGTATTFGTSLLTANGGTGAGLNTINGGSGGAGGSGTIGSGATGIVLVGGTGSGGTNTSGGSLGGAGGNNPFGGAGGGGWASSAGNPGAANTGGGGGGGGLYVGGYATGGGGGAGGYIEATIANPSPSYLYTVGAGAPQTPSGVYPGGAGGSGVIIVEEYYASQVISNYDGRVVSAQVSGVPANVTANNPIIFPTVDKDSNAAYNATTGQYTIQVSGVYSIQAYVNPSSATAGGSLQIYKNAALVKEFSFGGTANAPQGGSTSASFVVGDIVDIRPSVNMSTFATASRNNFTITLASGAQSIMAGQDISMRATSPSGTPPATQTQIAYPTVVYDSTGSYNSSTGLYTFSVSGKFYIHATFSVDGTFATSSLVDIAIFQNATSIAFERRYATGNYTGLSSTASATIKVVAGDTVAVKVNTNVTTPIYWQNAAGGNVFEIKQVN
jgi:hypothetical protein